MEAYTLDHNFRRDQVIDEFTSLIWTERYYGDGDVELVVPLSMDMIEKLKIGKFLALDKSEELRIVESMSIENNSIKVVGISILSWLNNRIYRGTYKHEDRYYTSTGLTAGQTLWTRILAKSCCFNNLFENGPHGLTKVYQLGIKGLTYGRLDDSGENITVAISFGPVYDAMRELAVTYEVGMKIVLTYINDKNLITWDQTANPTPVPPTYFHEFSSYKGVDRTGRQTLYPIVRFSPAFDSLIDVKEFQDASGYKTLVYSFAPSNPGNLADMNPGDEGFVAGAAPIPAGRASLIEQTVTFSGTHAEMWSWDVRAAMLFCDDITTDLVGKSQKTLSDILTSRAKDELLKNPFTIAVDGQIVPTSEFKYGVHYGLGDLIEIQGNSGAINTARITEHIRAQDSEGEKEYPTVTMLTN